MEGLIRYMKDGNVVSCTEEEFFKIIEGDCFETETNENVSEPKPKNKLISPRKIVKIKKEKVQESIKKQPIKVIGHKVFAPTSPYVEIKQKQNIFRPIQGEIATGDSSQSASYVQRKILAPIQDEIAEGDSSQHVPYVPGKILTPNEGEIAAGVVDTSTSDCSQNVSFQREAASPLASESFDQMSYVPNQSNIASSNDKFHSDDEYSEPIGNSRKRSKKSTEGPVRKRGRRSEGFDSTMKKKLCATVKQYPVIFDLKHPLHHNHDAVELAWSKVAETMGKTSNECKKCLNSLRDSNNYYKRKLQNSNKSGSSGGVVLTDEHNEDENDEEPQENGGDKSKKGQAENTEIEFEFAEDLAFLPDISKNRKTYISSTPLPETDETASNYSYMTNNSKTDKQKDEVLQQLTTSMTRLIESELNQMNSPPEHQHTLKFMSMWAYFDGWLAKMPEKFAEEIELDFTEILMKKIREARQQN